MSSSFTASSVVLSDLTFSWPDGRPVFDGLNAIFDTGLTGLVGANGTGKSTLLSLIAGERHPARGSVTVTGHLRYLPQDIALRAGESVASLLGIAGVRQSLRRIEIGDASTDDFDVVGDQWDIDERALAMLGRVGLSRIASTAKDLDRAVPTLSGGESTLLGLLAQVLGDPAVLLLDEPTNNLDASARGKVYDILERFTGSVIVVSHDRDLLERMGSIVEIRSVRGSSAAVRTFGGNYSAYREQIDAEQIAAQAAVRDAARDVRKQSKELVDTHVKLDRRKRYGQKMFEQKREPKIVMGMRKRSAQVSAGRLRIEHEKDLEAARDQLSAAQDSVRDDREIRVDLPDTQVHAGQRVLAVDRLDLACGDRFPGRVVSLAVVGPERIALTGANGIGKTTLLEALRPTVPWAYLRQQLDVFDESASVIDNVARRAPHVRPDELRGRLARFLFRGNASEAPVHTLSGGERLRAALATVLLADPAPRLLILDEPTNNLDLPSLTHLTEALASFAGALIVVSHDERFLDDVGITRRLELTETGVLE